MSTEIATTIGHSTSDKVVLFGGLPLAGAVLGFFLPRIADWAAGEVGSVPGPARADLDMGQLVGGRDLYAVGLLAGILLAGMALEDTLKVTITNSGIEFLKNQKTVRVPRDQVAVVFLDGREIVVQDPSSRELARERHDQLRATRSRSRSRSRRTGIGGRRLVIPTATGFVAGSRTNQTSRRR